MLAALRTEELAPGGACAPRRRTKTASGQRAPHRARRYGEAELEELAGDALVAPARVLAREPEHELALLDVDRGAPWTHASVGPPPPHELAVPSEEGLGCDEQAMSA